VFERILKSFTEVYVLSEKRIVKATLPQKEDLVVGQRDTEKGKVMWSTTMAQATLLA